MSDLSPGRQDKFSAYRARKRAAGLREVRLWAPDIASASFEQDLDVAIAAINASRDSVAAVDWCERAAADLWSNDD